MRHISLLCTALCLLLCHPQSAGAQRADSISTPYKQTTYMVGLGPTKVLDTYLSAEHFSGTGFSFLSTMSRHRTHRRWYTLLQHQASVGSTRDRSHDIKMLEACYRFTAARLRKWQPWQTPLILEAGGAVGTDIGALYNTLGGNNPGQVRLGLYLMPVVAAGWHTRIAGRKAGVRAEAELPLAGVMFSPNYGQSYYEIFSRGDNDHNIVPTTFVSAPNFRLQLMFNYQIAKRCALQIGYLADLRQAAVNQLKQHIYSHRCMVGVMIQPK